jgi:poly-gamma-glutamate synthesis protein (capsule biosynthesis protein)
VQTPTASIPTATSPSLSLPSPAVYLPVLSSAGVPVGVDAYLPSGVREAVQIPPGFALAERPEGAALRLEASPAAPLSRWVYALAAPFPTILSGVSSAELRQAWSGNPTGAMLARPILVAPGTHEIFTRLWGASSPSTVAVIPEADLLAVAWERLQVVAILPFEALEPRWKTLEVDGQSPLRKNFDAAAYPLSAPLSLQGDPALVEAVSALYGPGSAAPLLPAVGNRDPGRLTVLAMTGVTALVRATAFTMERRGVLYPGKDVGDILRNADITHISNEVPFASDCPYPNPTQPDMRFCSDDRYLALLQDMSADVIELTGDHFADWGAQAMRHTLDLYDGAGMRYYGGGRNFSEGRQALIVEHNGNQIAFIGCNGKGGGFATAGDQRPGAVTCDFDFLQAEIARLRAEGYQPVATFQHFEYYTYKAQPDQVRDFHRLAEAGAIIVSGSQAHQPQALDFAGGALIHYGLGNLFFDQYDVSEATRQGFIDRHVFYDGRYLGAELLGIQFVDYARPRPMTAEEQGDLLNKVFKASGW